MKVGQGCQGTHSNDPLDLVRHLVEAGGEYPFTITVTFVGVRGLTAPRENFDLGPKVPFPRDVVLPATLRPTFDALWQSLGHERSRNYEADGTWKGKLA